MLLGLPQTGGLIVRQYTVATRDAEVVETLKKAGKNYENKIL